MIKKFILKTVIAPFVTTVSAKVGEAVGDLLAWHINPPEEPAAVEVITDADIVEG